MHGFVKNVMKNLWEKELNAFIALQNANYFIILELQIKSVGNGKETCIPMDMGTQRIMRPKKNLMFIGSAIKFLKEKFQAVSISVIIAIILPAVTQIIYGQGQQKRTCKMPRKRGG